MKTSTQFRLMAAIFAATLFFAAFGFLPISVHADKAEDAAEAAKKATEAAEKATKDAAKVQKDADEAEKKAGAAETQEDKDADVAAKEADEAAEAADKAQDEAQKQQQEADDAAADAKAAGGSDEEKNKKAAEEQKEADEAAAEAKHAEKVASEKEKESDEADKKADDADKKIENRDVKRKKKAERLARKKARAARRAAAKRIREAKKLLDERKRREGKNPTEGTKELEKLLEELRKRLYPRDASEGPPKQGAVQPSAGSISQTINANGLHTVNLDTLHGRVIVHLPDDMRAGDTISGTVVVEPKGQTEEERAKNQDLLAGYVVRIGDQKVPAANTPFKWDIPFPPQQLHSIYKIVIVESSSNKEVANTTVPVLPEPPNVPRPQTITPNDFRFPTIGQQGRPVEISGPFDGNSSNTTLGFGPARSTVQDFEKNTENISGGFGLLRPLVESSRKMVFESPTNFTGPVQLILREGDMKTLAPYRNVGVRLSAPKTNLLRGERTTLTVEVRGLEGIQKDVPLELDSKGVITMEGGNSQNLRIGPTEVNRDGLYTTTRAITGQQAGAFTVTATVVVGPAQQNTNPSQNTPAAGGVLAKPLTQNEKDALEEEAHNMTDEQLDARLKDLGQALEAEGRDHGTETDKYKRLKEELDIFNAERRKRN